MKEDVGVGASDRKKKKKNIILNDQRLAISNKKVLYHLSASGLPCDTLDCSFEGSSLEAAAACRDGADWGSLG